MRAGAFRSFIGLVSIGFRKLLHQEAMAVAMRHFMFALSAGDVLLIDVEEQKRERHSIQLHRNRRDAEPGCPFNMKRNFQRENKRNALENNAIEELSQTKVWATPARPVRQKLPQTYPSFFR